MTENEAKGWLEYIGNMNLPYDRSPKSRKLACDMAIQALEKVQKFEAIGTVEEFKALKEKSAGKKIVYVSNMGVKTSHCPNCDMELTMNMYQRKFCDCGQKLDWQ